MTSKPHRKPADHPRDIIKSLTAICLTLLFFVFADWGFAAEQESSSETVTLKEAVRIPIQVQGKQVGATTVPAGTKVTVVARDGERVSVKHGALEPVWVEESQVSGLAAKQPNASKPARSSASITPEQLSSLVAAKKWEELASACETLAQQDSEKFPSFSDLGNQLRSALQAKAAATAQQTKAEAEAKRLRRNADVVGQPNRLNPSDRSPMERAQKLREQADAVIEEAMAALKISEAQIAQVGTQISSEVSEMVVQPTHPSLNSDDRPSTPTEMPTLAVSTSESAERPPSEFSPSPNTNEGGSAITSSLEFRRGPNIRGLQLGMTLDELEDALSHINPRLEKTEGKTDKDTRLLEDQDFGSLLAKSTQVQIYRFFDPDLKKQLPYPPAVIAVGVLIPSQVVISIEWNAILLPEYVGIRRPGGEYFTEFCEELASAYGVPNLKAVDGNPNILAHASKSGYSIQIKKGLGMLLMATRRKQEARSTPADRPPSTFTHMPKDSVEKMRQLSKINAAMLVLDRTVTTYTHEEALRQLNELMHYDILPKVGLTLEDCVKRAPVSPEETYEHNLRLQRNMGTNLGNGWTDHKFRCGDFVVGATFDPSGVVAAIRLFHLERALKCKDDSLSDRLSKYNFPNLHWDGIIGLRSTSQADALDPLAVTIPEDSEIRVASKSALRLLIQLGKE